MDLIRDFTTDDCQSQELSSREAMPASSVASSSVSVRDSYFTLAKVEYVDVLCLLVNEGRLVGDGLTVLFKNEDNDN